MTPHDHSHAHAVAIYFAWCSVGILVIIYIAERIIHG